jgi:hypothetical protein
MTQLDLDAMHTFAQSEHCDDEAAGIIEALVQRVRELEAQIKAIGKTFGAWAVGESDKRIAELENALAPFAEAYENNPVHSDPEFKNAARALRGES